MKLDDPDQGLSPTVLNDCRVLTGGDMCVIPRSLPRPLSGSSKVILEERWAGGEWFRSGAFWSISGGTVFYFRPGHETYPIYKQPIPLRIITNAVRFLAGQ